VHNDEVLIELKKVVESLSQIIRRLEGQTQEPTVKPKPENPITRYRKLLGEKAKDDEIEF
jgi:hypothetical protein